MFFNKCLIMFTIANGLILKGKNLQQSRKNILIDDGKILEINKDVKEGEIIDASGCIVFPSFLNGHTHVGDSIIKDDGYGLSLDEMVKPPNGIKHVALSESNDEDLIENMKYSLWDMYNSGITHFIDYREGGVKGVKLLQKASEDIPITPIILGRDDSFYGENPDLKKVKIAIRKLLKCCDGIAPSGFGEIQTEVAELIVNECNKHDKISSIHTAESMECQINSLEKYGQSEIERAISCGFNQIVHGTNSLNDDLNLIANSNTNLVLCPRANATLSVGWPQLNQIIKYGIRPLLGSDNIMLNSPSLFRELEFIIKSYSLKYGISISPKDILKMATTNVCYSNINQKINKYEISEGSYVQLAIIKQKSKNPYLSLINRSGAKDIINVINIDNIHKIL